MLAYKADTGRHLVLWEDGEDEWIDISKEQLTWHSDRGKSSGYSTGLPAGEHHPALHVYCLRLIQASGNSANKLSGSFAVTALSSSAAVQQVTT